MKNTNFARITTAALVWVMLSTALAFGQAAVKTAPGTTAETARSENPFAAFLIEVAGTTADNGYAKEADRVAALLAKKGGKNAVLIDDNGYARGMVVESAAAKLAARSDKRLYRINWNAVFATIKGILGHIASVKETTAIYLDDIAGFSTVSPMMGRQIATNLYAALTQGKIQVFSAADMSSFRSQIVADARLKTKFEMVRLIEGDNDGFVGDKISPDLRELMAGADKNRTVKVILQSDDIDNPQLIDVLRKNNINIGGRANALNMLFIDLPLNVAEAVAAVRSAKHLSLDNEVKLLGHVEETTGASLVRNQTTTVFNAQGTPVNTPYQLDGTGMTVAVVDSGIS